jgi:hypothetical protein
VGPVIGVREPLLLEYGARKGKRLSAALQGSQVTGSRAASGAGAPRQVLSIPRRLRYHLQHDREALNSALRIFLGVIKHHLRSSLGTSTQARTGAVAPAPAPQRVMQTKTAVDLPGKIWRSPARFLWVLRLERVYAAFPCPAGFVQTSRSPCGSRRQCRTAMWIIAYTTEAMAIRDILKHIGEPATPPITPRKCQLRLPWRTFGIPLPDPWQTLARSLPDPWQTLGSPLSDLYAATAAQKKHPS